MKSLLFGAARPYEHNATIHELFAREAARRPAAIAVESDAARVSYGELQARSHRLAQRLRASGVAPGDSVGVALERSAEMPVAFLGVLKAGAAYVPLDPAYPAERLTFMMCDAGVRCTVTQRSIGDFLPCERSALLFIDDALPITPDESHAVHAPMRATSRAYIMYTSGSTGRPKGVAVTHRGVVRLVRNTDYATFSEGDTALLQSPATFDASTFEMWGALLNGARLAVPRHGLLAIEELCGAVERFGVTTMFLTPSLFVRLVDHEPHALGTLRQLVLGGDVVPARHARRFVRAFPDCRLINGYGPTENTTFSTWYAIPPDAGDAVPIGAPIANASAYVLDEDLCPVEAGVTGELYVGGDGVAQGYVNLVELTRERFLPDPFARERGELGANMYKTGDLARMRSDGLLEFLGRRDGQVKIRGFRVETGEVEAALRMHRDVAEAAVVVRECAGDKQLYAYAVAAKGRALDAATLRQHMRATLPEHAVPHVVSIVQELPRHNTGKVDRVALAHGSPVSRPLSGAQRIITEIWRDVLGSEQTPGLDENFFDVGGDSLRLITVHARMRERFAIPLSIVEMFGRSTIRKLAAAVAERGAA